MRVRWSILALGITVAVAVVAATAGARVATAHKTTTITFWDVESGKNKDTGEGGARRPRPRLFRWVWDEFPSIFEEYMFVPLCVTFTAEGQPIAYGYDNRHPELLEMRRCQVRTK